MLSAESDFGTQPSAPKEESQVSRLRRVSRFGLNPRGECFISSLNSAQNEKNLDLRRWRPQFRRLFLHPRATIRTYKDDVMTLRLLLSRTASVTFILIATLFQAADARTQTIHAPDGHWEGTMVREGASLPVRFDFRTDGGAVTGRFTSETQSAMEYPLSKVDYSPPALHWKLASLVFDGVVSPQEISGTFLDGKEKGAFSLKPVRPEEPPYRREEVTFRNGSVVLSGTLLLPRSTAPRHRFPAWKRRREPMGNAFLIRRWTQASPESATLFMSLATETIHLSLFQELHTT